MIWWRRESQDAKLPQVHIQNTAVLPIIAWGEARYYRRNKAPKVPLPPQFTTVGRIIKILQSYVFPVNAYCDEKLDWLLRHIQTFEINTRYSFLRAWLWSMTEAARLCGLVTCRYERQGSGCRWEVSAQKQTQELQLKELQRFSHDQNTTQTPLNFFNQAWLFYICIVEFYQESL